MKPSRPVLGVLSLGLVCLSLTRLWHTAPPPLALQSSAPRPAHRADPVSQKAVVAATASPLSPWVAALREAEAEPDAMKRDTALQAWVDSLSADEIPAVLREIRARSGSASLQLAQVGLVRRWTESDPHAAAGWAEQMPPGKVRQESLSGVAIVWANFDLQAASQWACQLPDGLERASNITNVAYEAARSEPQAALQLAAQLPPATTRDELIRHATRQWALLDASDASQWAQQLEDAPLRTQVLADIAVIQAESDPGAAATLVLTLIPAGQGQDDALVGIVQRWSQQDASQTGAWVELFPEGALRDAAVDNLLQQWTQQDPSAPVPWLTALPIGPLRDAALETFAREVAPVDHEAALAWATTIGESTRRNRSQQAVSNGVQESSQ